MKNVTIIIDDEKHRLVYLKERIADDCDRCSLKEACDKMYDLICKLSGADLDYSFYFERV